MSWLLKLHEALKQNNLKTESLQVLKLASFLKEADKKEDTIQLLLKTRPQYENELREAAVSVEPPYLRWVVQQLDQGEQLPEIVNGVAEFKKFKNRLTKKDLFAYPKLRDLRSEIEALGASRSEQKKQERVEFDYDVIFKNSDYTVFYPKNRATSCHLGQGTKWCVSATTSANYYNQYAFRNVFVYFIITKGEKANQNPNMSKVGFSVGESDYTTRPEIEIYDAADQKISENILASYLGESYEPIYNAIINDFKTKGTTPYRASLENLSFEKFQKMVQKVTDPEELESLFSDLSTIPTDPKILQYLFENRTDVLLNAEKSRWEKSGEVYPGSTDAQSYDNILEHLIKNPNSPVSIFNESFRKALEINDPALKEQFLSTLLHSKRMSSEQIKILVDQLLKTSNNQGTLPPEHHFDLIQGILIQPNLDAKDLLRMLEFISQNPRVKIQHSRLLNEITSKINFDYFPEIEEFCLKNKNYGVILDNPTSHANSIREVYQDLMSAEAKLPNSSVLHYFRALLQLPNIPEDVIKDLAENISQIKTLQLSHKNLGQYLATNPNISPELLAEFAQDSHPFKRDIAAQHPKTPKHLLEHLFENDPYNFVSWSAEETLRNLKKEK